MHLFFIRSSINKLREKKIVANEMKREKCIDKLVLGVQRGRMIASNQIARRMRSTYFYFMN